MIKAEVVADSLSPQGDRLISLLITFPRMILAEVNTHRMLSKNTSSSRAIPFEKMVEAIKNDPFIPIAWQKDHKGMQGSEYMLEDDVFSNMKEWLQSRDYAIKQASYLYERGVTKQLCNRLLEPWMWTTMLITGPMEGWNNFFTLRCPQYYFEPEEKYFKSRKEWIDYFNYLFDDNKDWDKSRDDLWWLQQNKGQAEIHMMQLAECIYDAMNESIPNQLNEGEWHIPFRDKIDYEPLRIYLADKGIMDYDTSFKSNLDEYFVKISIAMAARTSYTVIGDEKKVDYEKLIELHDRLITQNPPHSSPLEHIARCMSKDEYYSFIKGKVLTGKDDWGYCNYEYYPEFIENGEHIINEKNKNRYGWSRNFKGFIPYRAIIEEKL